MVLNVIRLQLLSSLANAAATATTASSTTMMPIYAVPLWHSISTGCTVMKTDSWRCSGDAHFTKLESSSAKTGFTKHHIRNQQSDLSHRRGFRSSWTLVSGRSKRSWSVVRLFCWRLSSSSATKCCILGSWVIPVTASAKCCSFMSPWIDCGGTELIGLRRSCKCSNWGAADRSGKTCSPQSLAINSVNDVRLDKLSIPDVILLYFKSIRSRLG